MIQNNFITEFTLYIDVSDYYDKNKGYVCVGKQALTSRQPVGYYHYERQTLLSIVEQSTFVRRKSRS